MEGFEVANIDEQKIFNGVVFPLTLSPKDNSLQLSLEKLVANHLQLDNLLRQHKAILLRGLSVQNFNDFHEVVIATANESPSSEVIPFHHEMAQTPNPPTHLFFYCDTPPSVGGETPILISHLICDKMFEKHGDFMRKVESLGVKYVRYMPEEDDPTSAIGRGWKSTFGSADRESAEKSLLSLGSSWEWLPDGTLKTVTAVLPAIRHDSGPDRSNQRTFFNSIVAAYTGWNDSRNVGRRAVVTADDQELDPCAMADAVAIMNEVSVAFKWQKGDVLLIDNRTAMHARRSYEGPRRILASLVRDPSR